MITKPRFEKAIHAQKLSEFYYRMARISDGARSVSYQDRASHWAHIGRSNLFRLIGPKVPASLALQRITDALCEDILSMSDEEVLQEFRDQGLDPVEEAAKGRAIIEQAIAQASARRVPADDRRYPPGCPDGDWCRGNRMCFWDCRGDDIGDAP